jgi:hypothetical protein
MRATETRVPACGTALPSFVGFFPMGVGGVYAAHFPSSQVPTLRKSKIRIVEIIDR